MQVPIPDITPEQMEAIQKDVDLINREFTVWVNLDVVLVSPPISAMAEYLWEHCLVAMGTLVNEDKQDEADTQPVSTLINALSFGMHLGKLGYDENSFTQVIRTELSEEDERRLLGDSDHPGESAGTGI